MSEVSPETLQNPDAASQINTLVEVISRSQHNYRELIDNLDLAVFTLSADGEVRVANRLFSQIVDAPFHELIGHRLSEFVLEPSLEELQRQLPRLIETGAWVGRARVRLAKETSSRVFSCWLQPILENNRVAAVIGWARDISSQDERDRNFTELFSLLHEGVFVTTPEGKVLDANLALMRILGYDNKEEFLRVNCREWYENPLDREALLISLLEKGSVEDREIRYVRKDGKRIWCLWRGYAVKDTSGRLVRLFGLIADITERRDTERRLREEQRFVQRVIDGYPDGILVFDPQGRFIYANSRVAELTGRNQDELIGSQMGLNVAPEDAPRLRQHFADFLAGKQVDPTNEFRVVRKDGSYRTFRGTIAPMLDESGKMVGVISSTRDITEARRTEKLEREREKFAAMGQMLAGAAHELNNPLTAILGVADLLRERAPDDAGRRHADLVLQQARRAAGIIQGLLAFSRHSAQGWTNLELSDLLKQVVEGKKSAEMGGNSVQFHLNIDPNLAHVAGDAKLLTQVFHNIITNAEQSIASGRASGSITISAEQAGSSICVSIIDDGPGIAPGNLAKIFDPFFTTKRPGGGSGLGLTIALAVVKEHGGDIKARIGPGGKGACVQVFLPVADGPPCSEASRGCSARANKNGLAGRSVLIVDDEESIREIACEGLAAKGMTVHEAATAEAGLEFFASSNCDVVLCDFNLAGAKGEMLYEGLQARRPGNMPRFVFMTGGLLDSETLARFERIGARLLQKPFPVSTLANLVAEVLEAQPAISK